MEKTISSEMLNEIERRCNAATLGPWKSFIEGRDCESGSSFIQTGGEDIYLSGATAADQDFIAGARQDILVLVDTVRSLQNMNKAK
jgi:hypothetical protein